jgi:hypothetical protein
LISCGVLICDGGNPLILIWISRGILIVSCRVPALILILIYLVQEALQLVSQLILACVLSGAFTCPLTLIVSLV